MKPKNSISRSPINDSKVSAQDFPKSGFNLAYRSYKDFVLGRLHVGGFHHMMPGDKFSGMNHGEFTLNQLAAGIPMLSPISISQHNFFVTYRSIDTTFEDGQTPTRLNSMSASWHTPKFHLNVAVSKVLGLFKSSYQPVFGYDDSLPEHYENLMVDESSEDEWMVGFVTALKNLKSDWVPLPSQSSVLASGVSSRVGNLYLGDAVQDALEFTSSSLQNIVFDGSLSVEDVLYIQLIAFLTPWVGKGSLICSLGYNYLRQADMRIICSERYGVVDGTLASFLSALDNIPQCEYGVRAYIAIWEEHYRDYNLEPRTSNLPWYRNFAGTSIVEDEPLWLLNRIRSWSPDVFTSALPDDPSRHVFAPIFIGTSTSVSILTSDEDFESSEANYDVISQYSARNLSSYKLEYTDSLSGSLKVLTCPLPKNVNDALVGSSDFEGVYELDLQNLRKSQMLEQYLKRNFYFGDEYADRLLAHYGSELSDYRINRPAVLSSSVDVLQNSQLVNSTGTAESYVGERTATATGQTSNDGYSGFAEEFGIIINMISFVPSPMYAGACMQNFLDVQTDFPLPEFANQNDEFGRVIEIATSGLKKSNVWDKGCFGHYPAYHAYRARVDHLQDSFLDDKQNWTFRRFFGMDSTYSAPKLNYEFIHCRPNLGMFLDNVRLDGQLYGWINHEMYVERVLPTPTEKI